MKITLKIVVTKHNKLKFNLIDSQNNETIIKFYNQEEYTPCISFTENQIYCHEKQNENEIYFMNHLIDSPEDFKLYTVKFQNKEYSLIAEVFIALILSELKLIVEKDFIIEKTILEIEQNNEILLQRISIALETIGFNGIEFNDQNIEFDYTEQGELLEELLPKKSECEKYQRLLERAYNLSTSQNEKYQLQQSKQNVYSEETFVETIQYFSMEQRNRMKLSQLDNYCLFIVSRYFDSLSDHINFVKVCKRLKRNGEKFHYNPISVDEITMNFFPNIETLHLYENTDIFLKGGRISCYVDWNRRKLCESETIRNENMGKSIKFKNVVYTYDDYHQDVSKQTNGKRREHVSIQIPEGVREIERYSFCEFNYITSLSLPMSIKVMDKYCLTNCRQLKNLIIPQNETRVVQGNKVFDNKLHFDILFKIPQTVRLINGETCHELTSIKFPTNITSIDNNCFMECENLKEVCLPESLKTFDWNGLLYSPKLTKLQIPESFTDIPHNLLMQLKSLKMLKEVIISKDFKLYGNKFIAERNGCLYPFEISKKPIIINGNSIVPQSLQPLKKFTIPSTVTKLNDYCFKHCPELQNIQGLENIKEFGKASLNGSFEWYCKQKLMSFDEQLKILYGIGEQEKKYLHFWTGLKLTELVFDSDIDDWTIGNSVLNKRIIGRKQLLFIVEDEDDEKFGYYLNTNVNEIYHENIQTDKFSFHFNYDSNGRLNQPMKFHICDLKKGGYFLYNNDDNELIKFGNILLFKQMKKESSYTCEMNDCFIYNNINKALCGKRFPLHFIPNRIMVFQMN